jgi:DNA-binding beta-propeller fold protein YncE
MNTAMQDHGARRIRGHGRSLLLIALAALTLVLLTATVALAVGELSQKPGTAGCISVDGSGERCQRLAAIEEPTDVAVSPDGRNVYVVGSDSVTILDRDPATGELAPHLGGAVCIALEEQRGCENGRALDGARAVTASPDGGTVYVASRASAAVAVFDRGPSGGLIQKPGEAGCSSLSVAEGCRQARALGAPSDVAVSPDGSSVYVSSSNDSVAVFGRDGAGVLTQASGEPGCIASTQDEGCRLGRGLMGAAQLATSPDGKNVYVVSPRFDSGVAILDRDPAAGGLTQKGGASGCIAFEGSEGCQPGRALLEPFGVAVSPDGRSVYVASGVDAIAVLSRDLASGSLSQRDGAAGCVSTSGMDGEGKGGVCQAGRGLDEPLGVALSPGGESLYVSSSGSDGVAIFDRDAREGLTQKPGAAACISEDGGDGCQSGVALDGLNSAAVSPDGRNVYATAPESSSIAIFDRAVPSPADTTAPTVSEFKLAPARFRVAPRGGSHFRFALSEPASVRIAVDRVRPGRRVGKRCKAPTPRLAKRRRCVRITHSADLDFANLAAGANSIAFGGRIGRRALVPGNYRVTIVATDAAGNLSAPRQARFAVLAKHR